MSGFSQSLLVDELQALGIRKGSVLHVHSALFTLGMMEGVAVQELPSAIYRAIRQVIGQEGTLTVPTAFEDYARFGTPYDCKRSPVDRAQGIFSQFVANLPDAVRTYNPMCAVTGIGPLAHDICHVKTASAFGSGSAWEKLYDHDAQMCFLGVRPSLAFTFTVFIQFRYGAPYFYNKLYRTPILEDGEIVSLPVTCPVRYLDSRFRISENCIRFEEHLTQSSLIKSRSLGRGRIYAINSSKKIFQEGTKMLQQDLFYFCQEPPSFIDGLVPTDGPTGKFLPDDTRFGRQK